MTKENGVKVLTDMVADFVAHIGKKLPDDVVTKLEELGSQESAALPKVLYETMTKNQGLAVELNRPSCQDTGVLQFWLKCVHQRAGSPFERSCCTGYFCSTIKT
jgi:L(+)-tartrate dehydratase alpha subunit